MRPRSSSRAEVGLAVALAVATLPAVAGAHSVGLSRGDYTLEGRELSAELSFSRTELMGAIRGLDADDNLALDRDELTAGRPALEQRIIGAVHVTADTLPCPSALLGAELVEEDGATLTASFRCPERPKELTIELTFTGDLSHGHRHLATATAGAAITHAVAYGDKTTLRLVVPAAGPERPSLASGTSTGSFFVSLLGLGVQHILTGFDHLLFLLGLIVVATSLRSMIGVVTAFTAAHSLTLALATLGVVAPRATFVEPAIALSLVYVGVENLFIRDTSRRWALTFAFGLVHGFGFAGVLRELSVPSERMGAALLAFNLGVELGQLACLVPLLPLVLALRKRAWFADRGVQGLSLGVAGAGLVWFGLRVFGG